MLDRVLDKLQVTSVPFSIHKNQMVDWIGSVCIRTELVRTGVIWEVSLFMLNFALLSLPLICRLSTV